MNTKRKVNSKVLALVITLFIIVMSIVGYVLGKYVLNKQNDAEINFYEYRIAKSEILISPEEYTGEEATVTITTEKPGLSIEYKIGDSEEWIKYTGPFCVDENTNIEARLVAENFEGPITDKEVTNIAVCRIGDTYYKTVESAIDACPENAGTGQTKIEMLTSVTESVIIPEGKNIVLDLCGKTISSKKEIIDDNTVSKDYTIIVSGKFNLIDSEGNGGVEAQNGTAITVESTGDCTIGINESQPNVENKPLIKAEINGVLVKEGGKFNFYDGEISGKTNAIDGTVTGKPEGYAVVASRAGEYEVATLRKTYTIKYNKNSEDAEIEYESQTVNSGEKVGKLPMATRTGYIFEGWYTAENDGEKVTIDTIVNKEVTYYAHWTAVTYKIEYSANGGSGEPIKTDCAYDKEATIEKNTYTAPVGYIFKEWNTKGDGTGTTYAEGATIKNLSGTQLDIITLYAIWEDKTEPSNNAPTGTSTTSQITVNCKQKDEGSGIDETTIEYSIFKDGKWSEWQASNVFDGLDADTEYQIKTRATDKDGNGPTESEIGKTKTKNIQIGTITIHKDTPEGEIVTPKTNKEDNDEQINNNIHIDITPEEGTTTIKVKTPDGETKTYTEDVTIETETGVYEITIETTDGTNTVTETVYVFVDKTPPTVNPTETHTTNKITIDSNAKDDDSGIKEIKYIVKNGDEEVATIIKTPDNIDKTAEIPGLSDNTEYTIEIIVTDNTGNTSTKTITVKTDELLPGKIDFTETPSNEKITPTTNSNEEKVWTNENIKTELTPGNAGTTTYTVKKAGEEPGKKYTENTEISTTEGDYVVTVETTDGTNTKTITYYFSVDKTLPTVTIAPNGAEYTIAVNNNTANISTTLTSVDNENGSGISINKYAWSTSKEQEPDSWSDFVSGTPVTKSANGGVYFLWTKVIDNAGNEAVVIKISKEFDVGYAVEYDLNGGEGIVDNQRKVHGQDLTLTNSRPTKEGYIFKGWATSNNVVNSEYSSNSVYSKDESIILYAVWSEVVASTTIDGVTTNYDSVQNAINAAGTDTAVVTLLKNEIDESITIAAGQNITLDTNGRTLTSKTSTINNYGNLTIDGNGTISCSDESTISNYSDGNINVISGTITTNGKYAINSTSTEKIIIGTNGDESFQNPYLCGGINQSNAGGDIIVNSGLIEANGFDVQDSCTIYTCGNVIVNGGKIVNLGKFSNNYCIYMMNESKSIKITGGQIECNAGNYAVTTGNVIGGNIEITGGTIKSKRTAVNNYLGKTKITGGSINGDLTGVNTTSGSIEITGGNITAKDKALEVTTGSVTIGTYDSVVSKSAPVIVGEKEGIHISDEAGTFNFYDGIIKAPEESTIVCEVTETPRGYRVTNGEETIEGVKYETAYLDRANVEIEFNKTEYTYTGEEIIPEIKVIDKDIVLVKGEDYDVTYSNNVEAGTATVNVILKRDYSGTKTSTFTINKVLLTPIATANVKTYDGTKETTGNIYLTGSVNSENPVAKNTFKFEFENSTSGTNKTVNVTNIELADAWKKNYALSTNTLTLTDGTINKAKLFATYEGEEITFGQTPTLEVMVTGFVNNEDENTADGYAAPSIKNINTEVGTYTLIPAGGDATNYIFEYEGGTLVIKENMANVIVTLNPEKYVYDGTEKEPEVIVTDKNNGKILTYGTDYTLSYSDNINAGIASVTINLKGHYSGSVIETYTIERANGEATLSIEGWTYGEEANDPIVESTTNGIDHVTFTYTGTKNNGEQYSSNVAPTDAGSYTVKATFAKTTNYNQIVLEENFVIVKCVVTIPTANTELKYTGNAQTGVNAGKNYSITGNIQTNAGDYKAIVTLSDENNFEWEDKTVDSKDIEWTIAKVKLTPIATVQEKVFDGTTNASRKYYITRSSEWRRAYSYSYIYI